MSNVSFEAAMNCSHQDKRWEVSIGIDTFASSWNCESCFHTYKCHHTWMDMMLYTSTTKSDKRDWQYSKEQWVTAMHMALMDIKEWQQKDTDPYQDLGVTCNPWLDMCHWVNVLLWSSTHFDLGSNAYYLAIDNMDIIEVWKGLTIDCYCLF